MAGFERMGRISAVELAVLVCLLLFSQVYGYLISSRSSLVYTNHHSSYISLSASKLHHLISVDNHQYLHSVHTRRSRTKLRMAVEELFDEETDGSTEDKRTDEEKGLTHGYEGSFKVGQTVRVIKHMKIYSVRAYADEGFDPYSFTGKVIALSLYGRKYKTLCSAITPIIVEFQPNGDGIPEKMFDKKFQLHFEHTELELVQ